MKHKEVISAVVGSAFFAIPYLGLSVTLFPSLVIGCAAFGASELVFSGMKSEEVIRGSSLDIYQKISVAKRQNKEILGLIPKVEREETKRNLNEIHTTVEKIIGVVEKESKKGEKLDNFFDYYLPVLIKIVGRYDEIENQKLVSKEGRNFLEKADLMIEETKKAFLTILSSLYQKDLVDADAEMKVYNLMLKADGIVGDELIMKGSDEVEK